MSTRYRLGVNTCFAVKRWPEPARWAELVAHTLGLDLVQHSLDLVDLDADAPLAEQAAAVAEACTGHGIALHSVFTGLGAYGRNLLLDPDPGNRSRALAWLRRALGFAALAGGRAAGGHIGAFSVTDWRDADRRDELWRQLQSDLRQLAAFASGLGLDAVLIENMAVRREPSTMAEVESLLAPADERHAAVAWTSGTSASPERTGRSAIRTHGCADSARVRPSSISSRATRPPIITGRSPQSTTPQAASTPTACSTRWTRRAPRR